MNTIAACSQSDRAPEDRAARERLFNERRAGIEEYCCVCLRLLGFPQSLHYNDPRRHQGGMSYVGDGTGQLCALHAPRTTPATFQEF